MITKLLAVVFIVEYGNEKITTPNNTKRGTHLLFLHVHPIPFSFFVKFRALASHLETGCARDILGGSFCCCLSPPSSLFGPARSAVLLQSMQTHSSLHVMPLL